VSIEWVLRRQSGVISRRQALAGGMSEDQIDRLLTTGRWLPVRPRVYLAADRDLTDEARVLAVGLWAGHGGTITGMAAAWWHRLWPDPPRTVDITVPPPRGLRSGRGVRVRHGELLEADRVGIRGLTVTAVPLTVLEAAVALGEQGPALMDRALQGRVSLDALRRAHSRNLGRRGSAPAGRLLSAAADRAASLAERRAISLLRDAGIDGWRQHYRLGGFELDLAFAEQRVAIEVDGWAWHHDAETFRRDRQRQNALVLEGWTVLRFTWSDLTYRPDRVIHDVLTALDSRATA
jgi:very-short-patch-repair endonuclease